MTSRVRLVEVADMDVAQRAQYDRFPSNLTRALLLLDRRLAAALPEAANALRASSLAPAWREAVILRVAALEHSDYERFQHLGPAHKAGLTATQIADIEGGDYGALDAGLACVLRFVDATVAAPQVSDEVFDAARTALTDQHLATVIVLVGHYLTVARLTGILGVEVDDQPDSWTHEH